MKAALFIAFLFLGPALADQMSPPPGSAAVMASTLGDQSSLTRAELDQLAHDGSLARLCGRSS